MGLPDTRAGADEAERREVARVLNTGEVKKAPPSPRKEAPTVREFSKVFIEMSRITNKASTIDAKNAVLKCHLLPLIGDLLIDHIRRSSLMGQMCHLVLMTVAWASAFLMARRP